VNSSNSSNVVNVNVWEVRVYGGRSYHYSSIGIYICCLLILEFVDPSKEFASVLGQGITAKLNQKAIFSAIFIASSR